MQICSIRDELKDKLKHPWYVMQTKPKPYDYVLSGAYTTIRRNICIYIHENTGKRDETIETFIYTYIHN